MATASIEAQAAVRSARAARISCEAAVPVYAAQAAESRRLLAENHLADLWRQVLSVVA